MKMRQRPECQRKWYSATHSAEFWRCECGCKVNIEHQSNPEEKFIRENYKKGVDNP